MNKLSHLFASARAGLSFYEKTPDATLKKIAAECGRDEIAAIHIRLKRFRAELEMVAGWNGDEQDDIWRAIEGDQRLLYWIDMKKNLRE